MQAELERLSPESIRELDSLFERAADAKEPPGIVAAIANKDSILYHKAFGKRDVEKGVEMETDSLFRIFSMTKPITSVAVMMLFEQGLLDLDDPVSKYLPEYKDRPVLDGLNVSTKEFTTRPAAREATIRHLLTHTAGIGYEFKSETVGMLVEATGKKTHELPLLFEPGSQFLYGPNTHVLGLVVEAVSGMGLDEFFKEKIFGPLDMRETAFALTDSAVNRLVTRHERTDGVLVEKRNSRNGSNYVRGDHGLKSTAHDFAKFLQMLLKVAAGDRSQLIQPTTFELMAQNQIGPLHLVQDEGAMHHRSRPLPSGGGRDKFGLGFQVSIMEANDLRPRGSLSWSGIANTYFWIDRQNEFAAIILMQVDPYGDEACVSALHGFEQAIYRNLK